MGHPERHEVALKLTKPALQLDTQLFPCNKNPVKHWVQVFCSGHTAQFEEHATHALFSARVPKGHVVTHAPEDNKNDVTHVKH